MAIAIASDREVRAVKPDMNHTYVVVNMYRNQVTIRLPSISFDAVVYGKYDAHRFKQYIRQCVSEYDIPIDDYQTRRKAWRLMSVGRFDYELWKTEKVRYYIRKNDIEDIAVNSTVVYDSNKDKSFKKVRSNHYGNFDRK